MKIPIIIITIIIVINFILTPVALAATFSLSPTGGTLNRNCGINLSVNIDTAGAQTDGADAILIYDVSKFTANSITNGTIYPDYPGNTIDSPTPGRITISGLASLSSPFIGTGTLATVNFIVKSNASVGATQIKFDFNPNEKDKTDDSNVVERTTIVDILNSVTDGNYVIGSGTSCSGAVASPLPQGAPGGVVGPGGIDDDTKSTLPPAGTESLTATLAIVGTVLVILGILGLVIL